MNILLFFFAGVVLFIIPLVGLWKLFVKAGRPGWAALIPGYNFYLMLKISGRPAWLVIFLFIPVIYLLVAVGVASDFAKSYGKYKFSDKIRATILSFIYFPLWGVDPEVQYLGPAADSGFREDHPQMTRKSSVREWVEIWLFNLFFVLFTRTFLFEAYVVPTPSMDSTLMVGDYFFVNKLSYGARIPNTPVSIPFVGHTLPFTGIKSYWEGIKFPYFRLPGFGQVKRGDVIVFNYPMEAGAPYFRPVDKREMYIKRCEALPGDTLSIIGAQVWVNGKPRPEPVTSKTSFLVVTDNAAINPEVISRLHIDINDGAPNGKNLMDMTKISASQLKLVPGIKSITEDIRLKGDIDPQIFPQDPNFRWNADNYGPVIIPQKGWTVKLDSLTLPIYKRAIEVYENNQLTVSGNEAIINGKPASSYTFKQNYYWVMGDNRHDSADSRYWGFVPEDHIEGKAGMIWMSLDESRFRWDRFFKLIR